MNGDKLQEHFLATYCTLRTGLAFLATALPLMLVGIGWWYGLPIQSSMSAYYFAFDPPTSELRTFPVRVFFVGILFAIGCFLCLYRGFSNTENWFLNFAGISALLVAIFPMEAPDYCANCGPATFAWVHYVAAVALFVCVAFVALTCSEETLARLPDGSAKRRAYRMLYDLAAALMVLLPLVSVGLAYAFGVSDWKVFVAEFAGIYAFAGYWILKSVELCFDKDGKKADERAAMSQMQTFDASAPRTTDQKASWRLQMGRWLD